MNEAKLALDSAVLGTAAAISKAVGTYGGKGDGWTEKADI